MNDQHLPSVLLPSTKFEDVRNDRSGVFLSHSIRFLNPMGEFFMNVCPVHKTQDWRSGSCQTEFSGVSQYPEVNFE